MNAITLQIPKSLKFTDDKFVEIVAANKDLRLELSSQGELSIMSPTGGETGDYTCHFNDIFRTKRLENDIFRTRRLETASTQTKPTFVG